MYLFFSRVTGVSAQMVTPPDEWLGEYGFSCTRRHEFDWGLVCADKWVRDAM